MDFEREAENMTVHGEIVSRWTSFLKEGGLAGVTSGLTESGRVSGGARPRPVFTPRPGFRPEGVDFGQFRRRREEFQRTLRALRTAGPVEVAQAVDDVSRLERNFDG